MYKEVVPFAEAWSWQKSIVEERKKLITIDEDISDSLIVLQHEPVYTLGTASSENNLNFNVKDSPLPLYQTERGGEVTYHGPGQVNLARIYRNMFYMMEVQFLQVSRMDVGHMTFCFEKNYSFAKLRFVYENNSFF